MSFLMFGNPISSTPDSLNSPGSAIVASDDTAPCFDADHLMRRFQPLLLIIGHPASADDRTTAVAEYERLLINAYTLREDMGRSVSTERGILTLTIRRIQLAYQAVNEPHSLPSPIFEIGDQIKHRTKSSLTGPVIAVHITPMGRFYQIITPDDDNAEIYEASVEGK